MFCKKSDVNACLNDKMRLSLPIEDETKYRTGLIGNLINKFLKPRTLRMLMAGHALRRVTLSRWITKAASTQNLFFRSFITSPVRFYIK